MSRTKKNPMPEPESTKVRVNVSLNEVAVKQGELLCKEEQRSFSNLLERLIAQEHRRRLNPKQAA